MKRIGLVTLLLLPHLAIAVSPTWVITCSRSEISLWRFSVGERQSELCLTVGKTYDQCNSGRAKVGWFEASDIGITEVDWLASRYSRISWPDADGTRIYMNQFVLKPDNTLYVQHVAMPEKDAGFTFLDRTGECTLVNADAVREWADREAAGDSK